MDMNRDDVIREIQERDRQTGRSLNERERRLWAAAEALKLGRGGLTIVSRALRMSPNTIKRGIREIAEGETGSRSAPGSRIRRPAGGRRTANRAGDDPSGTRSLDRSAESLRDTHESASDDA